MSDLQVPPHRQTLPPKLAVFSFLSPKNVNPGCVMEKPLRCFTDTVLTCSVGWLRNRAEPLGFPVVTGVQAWDWLGQEENRLMPLVETMRY